MRTTSFFKFNKDFISPSYTIEAATTTTVHYFVLLHNIKVT